MLLIKERLVGVPNRKLYLGKYLVDAKGHPYVPRERVSNVIGHYSAGGFLMGRFRPIDVVEGGLVVTLARR